MMFFSLKCGALFDPLLDENEVKQDFQRLLILLQAIENAQGGSENREGLHGLCKVVLNILNAKKYNKLVS